MQADIDMSGRIEETNNPTAIALADGVSFSVLISGAEKRKAIAALKKQQPERDVNLLHIFVFTVLLYYLVQPFMKRLAQVRIDLEYPGHDAVIKNRVLTLCRNAGIEVKADQVTIGQVGKKSPAHKLAYSVYLRKRKPDRVITAREVLLFFRKK